MGGARPGAPDRPLPPPAPGGVLLLYAAYAPGFVIYATKFPKSKKWGYHEWFHLSVLTGNLVSMGFDLGVLGLFAPCAAEGCASLASRLTFGLLP